ncbi:MAG: hypothetical protein JXB49_17700, partial [Bacteroidales bacterium]|nr:hypothetical protein [Bacteroidales bacterium]
TANPVSGTVTGNSDVDVSVDIADLEPGTTYHFRVKADNSLGSVYGDNETFTTLFLVPTEGLVAYFPFNGNANDETVNGNHGTVSGALLTSDRFGNPNSAYSFDGINDNITGNTNNWPFARLSRTISLWANISAIPNNANKLFLEYGIGDEHTYQSIYFQNTETYGKRVVYGAMYDDVNTPFNYSINTWYNVIGTYDGTTAKIYINGDFIDGGNKTTWNTLIGDYFFGGSWTGFFFGLLDDIRIYNRVLSQEEILQLYNEIP